MSNCSDISCLSNCTDAIDVELIIEKEPEFLLLLILVSFLVGVMTTLLCCFCCCCTRKQPYKLQKYSLDLDDMHEVDEEIYEPKQAQAPPPEEVSQRLDPRMGFASDEKFQINQKRSKLKSANSSFKRQSAMSWISKSTGFFSSRTGYRFQSLPELKRQSKNVKKKSHFSVNNI